MSALTRTARGTFFSGSIVSPTWQVAASKAGAAKPMRYSPAIALVSAPNQPGNGIVRWKVVACFQSTAPVRTGPKAEINARPAENVAKTIASRAAHFTPQRFTAAKMITSPLASHGTRSFEACAHSSSAFAENIAVRPQVGIQPHQ